MQNLLKYDAFALKPSFNYKGKSHYTLVGLILTILIYALLLLYLIDQVYQSWATPNISSQILPNYSGSEIYISGLSICLTQTNSAGEFYPPTATNLSNYVIASSDPSGMNLVPLQAIPSPTASLCVGLTVDIVISLKSSLYFLINPQNFAQNLQTNDIVLSLSWSLPFTSFNGIDLTSSTPLTNEETLFANTSIYYTYAFDKIVYSIDDGHFFANNVTIETLDYALQRISLDYSKPFLVGFAATGRTITTSMYYTKFWDILAKIGGLHSTLFIIIFFLFSQYFLFKFYESLHNALIIQEPSLPSNLNMSRESNNSKVISIQSLELGNLRKGYETQFMDKELKISFWTFLKRKTFLSFCCPKRNDKSEQDIEVEVLDKWRIQCENSLDVVHYLKTE